jgi:hypothetical protein
VTAPTNDDIAIATMKSKGLSADVIAVDDRGKNGAGVFVFIVGR